MVAVTYGAGRAAAPAKTGTKGKNIFTRVIDAIAASQMKRAEREIARHRHLLPPNFDLRGTLWSDRNKNLPFGGW